MQTVTAWRPGPNGPECQTFQASTNGRAMDAAEEWGAIRIRDHMGTIYRKIAGEFVSLPLSRKPQKQTALNL